MKETYGAPMPELGTRMYTVNSLQYKIGRHGYVYVWLNNQWTKSTKSKSDLLKPKKLRRVF